MSAVVLLAFELLRIYMKQTRDANAGLSRLNLRLCFNRKQAAPYEGIDNISEGGLPFPNSLPNDGGNLIRRF